MKPLFPFVFEIYFTTFLIFLAVIFFKNSYFKSRYYKSENTSNINLCRAAKYLMVFFFRFISWGIVMLICINHFSRIFDDMVAFRLDPQGVVICLGSGILGAMSIFFVFYYFLGAIFLSKNKAEEGIKRFNSLKMFRKAKNLVGI